MGIAYFGSAANKATLLEQPGSKWSKDEQGMDLYSVRFGGPKTALLTFLGLSGNALGQALGAPNTSMKLISISDTSDRAFAYVDFTYFGTKGAAALPDDLISKRTAEKTATISVETPAADVDVFGAHVSRETSYSSPEIVYDYVSTSEKSTPVNTTGDSRTTTVFRSVVTGESGERRPGSLPTATASALSTTDAWVAKLIYSTPIRHTTLFLNKEVVTKEFPSDD